MTCRVEADRSNPTELPERKIEATKDFKFSLYSLYKKVKLTSLSEVIIACSHLNLNPEYKNLKTRVAWNN